MLPGLRAELKISRRVVIESVRPEVDGGRFAVKRIAGDLVRVEADIFCDGHDELAARLLYRREDDPEWRATPMALLSNDHWRGEFRVDDLATYTYVIEAWVEHYGTWQRDLRKRVGAGQDVTVELLEGARLIREAGGRATGGDAAELEQRARELEAESATAARVRVALDGALAALVARYGGHDKAVYDRGQRILAERQRARFSAWYELFPRSTAPRAGEHGTFRSTIDWLPYVAQMGFDILYLPPIHPIGTSHRKGKNNALETEADDLGSPWAIGSAQGGHTALNPALGTLADFRDLVAAAREQGMEIALDVAFQCSPDHPWVRQHPAWFRHRPDGRIRHAENPPKLYEDIYPFNFDSEDWFGLWQALEGVVRYWIEQGVRVFRVDNPHTKPFSFWEWLIGRVQADVPEVIFLSEAFTQPRTMQYLSKLGFTQSYTYFTWRNSPAELRQYLTELTQTEVVEYFRPNLWPNTPDILHEYLQTGGRPAFAVRLVLAATLSASYGIYGPPFELAVGQAREPGSEEYLDSEKYELRHWDLTAPHSLRELITGVNQARLAHPALQRNDTLRFLDVDNVQILAYLKTSADGGDVVIVVVNMDPHATQAGSLELPLTEIGVSEDEPYVLHDLIEGGHEIWQGEQHYVELDPEVRPARIFHLQREVS